MYSFYLFVVVFFPYSLAKYFFKTNVALSLFLFEVKEKEKGLSLPAFVTRFYQKTTKMPAFFELFKPTLAMLEIINTVRVMCQSLKLGVYSIPNHCKLF